MRRGRLRRAGGEGPWPGGTGLFHFEELSEEGDPHAGAYLAPSHGSGLHHGAEAAEREAQATLPWLRTLGAPR